MKVTICSSLRNSNAIQETITNLESLTITPLFPNFENNNTEEVKNKSKKILAQEHYEAIDSADVVYFLTPNGYMGTSCKLELGYSFAKKKPIYFSEPTNDEALDGYALDFIPTNNLEKFLHL